MQGIMDRLPSGHKGLHHNLVLTPEQIESAKALMEALDIVSDCNIASDDVLFILAMEKAVELSTHILRQSYGITNKVDPDTGASRTSAYIVPRAINLLALKRNGAFVHCQQITHITAAIRYVLRGIMLYNVMTREEHDDESAIDRDISQFLSRHQSSTFAYCVQLHAACSSYGSHSQLPTITWATDDFTVLCLDLDVPTHYARRLRDNYSNTEPGYSFSTETANALPQDYLWVALQRDRSLRGRYIIDDKVMVGAARNYLKSSTKLLETLFLLMHLTYGSPARMTEIDLWKHVNSVHGTAAVYKTSNGILQGYQQYLFAGHRGRFGAERLRRVVIQKTSESNALQFGLNVQGLRRALVAVLDHHVGHVLFDDRWDGGQNR
ncbi:hypothetical protein V1515DRAFT_582330 [Lipomyces mesembrius]